MKLQTSLSKFAPGQTLIETMAAIFILVMGITAAVGLAIYALGTATNVTKQIIATGLARQGIEAVKNMRDSNWLQQGTLDADCYNYATGSSNANCYTHWLNQTFCLDPSNNGSSCDGSATTQNYFLGIDPTSANFWNWQRQWNSSNYGLNFDSSDSASQGYYTTGANGVACTASTSGYCRKITITKDATAPFNQNEGPRLLVVSQVWWRDKKCPLQSDWTNPPSPCSVQLETYLTNWKDYGGAVSSATSSPPTTVSFTSSGSWQVPAGVTSVKVEAIGGGGGGGTGPGSGGGGGGAYATKTVTVTPGATIPYTIGAGGGTAGNGGDTNWNSGVVIAKGGQGNGGAGGQASACTPTAGAHIGGRDGGGFGGGGAAGANADGRNSDSADTTGGAGDSGDGGSGGGGNGTEWSSSPAYGSGGGGNGSYFFAGQAGGSYGAGGGVAQANGVGSGSGGAGAKGLIVVTY